MDDLRPSDGHCRLVAVAFAALAGSLAVIGGEKALFSNRRAVIVGGLIAIK